MVDYSQWDEKIVPVASLYLDPYNPRIPPFESLPSQRALIAELIEHDKVLELAKEIAEKGFYRVESLIGYVDPEDGKTYILEGNRRLAALKILLNPESAPDAMVKKVRQVAGEISAATIKKVRVLYAPTRPAAAPMIMQRHTRLQIERWSPLMQARFYRTLADSGLTPVEIAKQYGTTPGDVSEFLRTHSAYELARRIDLPSEIKAKVNDPREFEHSTLQRILDNTKARTSLGIDFDADGAITGRVQKDEFKKAFARILTDIVTGKINTRTVNKAKDIENYLGDIRETLPDKKKKGSFTAQDFEDKPSPAPTKPAKVPPKKAAAPVTRKSQSVVPAGTKCNVKSPRIKAIFDELRRLKLDDHSNASAVLFRIILEMSIGYYLDKTKKIEPLLSKAKKDGKAKDWYPTLRQMLAAMLDDNSIEIHTLARKKLHKLVSDKESSLSVDGLDGYVHNRFSSPTPAELRSYWDAFEGILAVVFEEPPAAKKSNPPPP